MQDASSGSYEQHVLVHKHIYNYKFIVITFPENSLGVFASVWPRYSHYGIIACKTYLFTYQKYFASIEMLYNILHYKMIFIIKTR